MENFTNDPINKFHSQCRFVLSQHNELFSFYVFNVYAIAECESPHINQLSLPIRDTSEKVDMENE